MSVQPQLIVAPDRQGTAQRMADLQRQVNEIQQSGGIVAGTVITGAYIQTAASGARIVLDGANDAIFIYDSGGNLRTTLNAVGIAFNRPSSAFSDIYFQDGSGNTITQLGAGVSGTNTKLQLQAQAVSGSGKSDFLLSADSSGNNNFVQVSATTPAGLTQTRTILAQDGTSAFVQAGTAAATGQTAANFYIVAPQSTSVFIAAGGTTTVTFNVFWNPLSRTTMIHHMFANGSLLEQLGWAISGLTSSSIVVSLHNSASSACAGTVSFGFIVYT
jgi:hypothetical protein